jgi:hypothetical protein
VSHFIDWEGLDFRKKDESQYEKYHKKPEHFKATFVGPQNTWGGKRLGAGRKPYKVEKIVEKGLTVELKLNRIQLLSLQELGNGELQAGVQALIDKYL